MSEEQKEKQCEICGKPEEYEKQLEEVGDKLGKLMGIASTEEKAKMREMIKEVSEFVEEEAKQGKYYDKSALFAAGLIAEPSINDEIKCVAKEYIEADYMFLKSKQQ